MSRALTAGLSAVALAASALAAGSDPLPPDTTYRPLPTMPFSQARAIDEAQKPQVMERQRAMLAERYDLADRPMPGVMMSGGLKPVQDGVRVRLPEGQTWDSLAGHEPGRDPRGRTSCPTASSRCRTSSRPPAARSSPSARSR